MKISVSLMDKRSHTTTLSKPVFSYITVTPGNMCFTTERKERRKKKVIPEN
jgi:hypothetical protein